MIAVVYDRVRGWFLEFNFLLRLCLFIFFYERNFSIFFTNSYATKFFVKILFFNNKLFPFIPWTRWQWQFTVFLTIWFSVQKSFVPYIVWLMKKKLLFNVKWCFYLSTRTINVYVSIFFYFKNHPLRASICIHNVAYNHCVFIFLFMTNIYPKHAYIDCTYKTTRRW